MAIEHKTKIPKITNNSNITHNKQHKYDVIFTPIDAQYKIKINMLTYLVSIDTFIICPNRIKVLKENFCDLKRAPDFYIG